MRYAAIALLLLTLVSCSEREKPKFEPIGVWENRVPWENNKITLTVRPDSTMLFKVEKNFCPGTKFFVAIGDWHIEHDSILVMETITDSTRHYEVTELFPELTQISKDSGNVFALSLEARLIMADSSLYDIGKDGKSVKEHSYGKIKN